MQLSIPSIALSFLALANLSHACIKAQGHYNTSNHTVWDWELHDNRIPQCHLSLAALNVSPAFGDGRETKMECVDNVEAFIWEYRDVYKVRCLRFNRDGTGQYEVRLWFREGTASLERGFEEVEFFGAEHCDREGDEPAAWP